MARYSVPLTTWANTAVEVDVPDDVTDPQEIADLAMEQMAENGAPTLCHQCAGGTRSGSQYLEIGDEWNPSEYEGKPAVTRLDG